MGHGRPTFRGMARHIRTSETEARHRAEEEARRPWWRERGELIIAVLAIVVISAISLLGAGFFFIPVAAFAAFVWLFVKVLRKIEFRNRYSDERPHLDERFADGQPYRRSYEHERERPYRERDERPPTFTRDEDMNQHAP